MEILTDPYAVKKRKTGNHEMWNYFLVSLPYFAWKFFEITGIILRAFA